MRGTKLAVVSYSCKGDHKGSIVGADIDIWIDSNDLLDSCHWKKRSVWFGSLRGDVSCWWELQGSNVCPVTSFLGGIAVVLYGILWRV